MHEEDLALCWGTWPSNTSILRVCCNPSHPFGFSRECRPVDLLPRGLLLAECLSAKVIISLLLICSPPFGCKYLSTQSSSSKR